MIGYLTLILTCQLIGESVATASDLPVPGPVLGMALLFVYLLIRGEITPGMERTSGGLLQAMSLLFVPAGTGVMLHFGLLAESLLPLSVAIVVSTSLTIVVTARLMQWLNPAKVAQDG